MSVSTGAPRTLAHSPQTNAPIDVTEAPTAGAELVYGAFLHGAGYSPLGEDGYSLATPEARSTVGDRHSKYLRNCGHFSVNQCPFLRHVHFSQA